MHMERETGNVSNSYYALMKNLANKRPKNWRLFKRNMKMYQKISQAIFPGWIRHFKPSEHQIQNYLKKIDSLELYKSVRVRKSIPIEV